MPSQTVTFRTLAIFFCCLFWLFIIPVCVHLLSILSSSVHRACFFKLEIGLVTNQEPLTEFCASGWVIIVQSLREVRSVWVDF